MDINKYTSIPDIEIGITREQYLIERSKDMLKSKPHMQTMTANNLEPSNIVPEDYQMEWADQGACNNVSDPSIFFPGRGERAKLKLAQSICASCIVRSECREYALNKPEPFGIWGGISEKDRNTIRQQLDLGKVAANQVITR